MRIIKIMEGKYEEIGRGTKNATSNVLMEIDYKGT